MVRPTNIPFPKKIDTEGGADRQDELRAQAIVEAEDGQDGLGRLVPSASGPVYLAWIDGKNQSFHFFILIERKCIYHEMGQVPDKNDLAGNPQN